jgi:hypothetical protein
MKPKIGTLIAHYGVAVLLTVFAGRQMYHVYKHDLTPWLGGGMGMFTTIDFHSNRIPQFWVETSEGNEFRIDTASVRNTEKHLLRSRIMPGKGRLSDLAKIYVDLSWQIDSTRRVAVALPESLQVSGGGLKPVSVRGELWRLKFEPSTREVHLRRLHHISVSNDLNGNTSSKVPR